MTQSLRIKCGECGAESVVSRRAEYLAFEASHDEEHGQGVAYETDDFPADLPD